MRTQLLEVVIVALFLVGTSGLLLFSKISLQSVIEKVIYPIPNFNFFNL